MGILKSQSEFMTYESTDQGMLVTIRKSEQSKIKKYWKTKDKTKVENLIGGFPFVQTDEQETLKIDFSKKLQFSIEHLKKFN